MSEATKENMERLGEAADTLDNLYHALLLPIPAQIHVDQLKLALPKIIAALREVYVAEVGDDPWM
jgi:hypothetical protein